eukprot:3907120-Amphidinium_carterae.1
MASLTLNAEWLFSEGEASEKENPLSYARLWQDAPYGPPKWRTARPAAALQDATMRNNIDGRKEACPSHR